MACATNALAINALAINALAINTLAINTLAINTLATNALAINALAINALAINALAIAAGSGFGYTPSAESCAFATVTAPASVRGAPVLTSRRRVRAWRPRRQRARPHRAYQALGAPSRTCAARTR